MNGKKLWKNRGFSTAAVIGLLILLSSLLLAAGLWVGVLRLGLERFTKRSTAEIEREEILQEILLAFSEDPTPESDSPGDPVWETIDRLSSPERALNLRDLSSRLNLNTLRHQQLEKTRLRSLIPGTGYEEWNAFREALGPTLNPEDYLPLISEEPLEEFFTVYGLINLNISYERSLETLALAAGESEITALNVREEVRSHLLRGQLFTESEAEILLESTRLQPLFTLEPVYNLHFLPEILLRGVLEYPYGETVLENHDAVAEEILHLREYREILPEDLSLILDAEDQQRRIFAYLGTKTWFWELQMGEEATSFTYVIARIPGGGFKVVHRGKKTVASEDTPAAAE